MSGVRFPQIDYLLVGHITADITPEGRKLGGTSSYAAATAHAFGLRVGVVTSAVADDPLLDLLRQWAFVHVIPAGETTTFENIYAPEGRVQYIRGVAESITVADLPEAWLSARLVHLAPMASEVESNVVFAFPAATRLLTLQGWLRQWQSDGQVQFRNWYDSAVLDALDFVVFSEEDIRESPEMEQMIARHARNLIVTRAEQGGDCYHDGTIWRYLSPAVEVVNPTGAGDVFAASLLAAYAHTGGDVKRSVKIAARLASICVTRHGLGGAPTADEVNRSLDTESGETT